MAHAFPILSAQQIISILFQTADDLGAAGIDGVYGRGRLNITRAFQPVGTTSLAGTAIAVGAETGGDLPPAAGDGGDPVNGKLGAIILDGYSRAFSINLAAGLRRAEINKPLHRSLSGNVKNSEVSAGPISVAMSVSERPRDKTGAFDVASLGIGPDDAAKAKLVAASAIARLDRKTAIAFGFAEGAKAIERRLAGAEAGAFLIAKDIAGEPGFAAKRGSSMAVRRDLGPVSLTVSSEEGEVWQESPTRATGSPYRWTTASIDRDFGKTWASLSLSRLDEKDTMLGGRVGDAFGGGSGSTSTFLDLELRRQFGSGFSATASARRGWTSFAGGSFESGAYAVDFAKEGMFNLTDRIALRVSQPLRIEKGGFSLLLPTGYDYATESATTTLSRFSLSPSGREVDGELSYSTNVGSGWLSGNLFYRHQPDHRAYADADVGAALRYSLRF